MHTLFIEVLSFCLEATQSIQACKGEHPNATRKPGSLAGLCFVLALFRDEIPCGEGLE